MLDYSHAVIKSKLKSEILCTITKEHHPLTLWAKSPAFHFRSGELMPLLSALVLKKTISDYD